jgi:hypothetical protein
MSPTVDTDGGDDDGGIVELLDGGILHATELEHYHVAACDDPTVCGNGTEPPVGGPHCPVWLNCRVWAEAQERCEYIHNLEHGHMVMVYNCPSGCDDIVATLTAYFNSKAVPRRILVVPDPLLKHRVAAMVWGWGYEGDTIDNDTLDTIYAHHDEEAPEAGLACDP